MNSEMIRTTLSKTETKLGIAIQALLQQGMTPTQVTDLLKVEKEILKPWINLADINPNSLNNAQRRACFHTIRQRATRYPLKTFLEILSGNYITGMTQGQTRLWTRIWMRKNSKTA